MGTIRRRRFPVLSRLTLAWMAMLGGAAVFGAYSLLAGSKTGSPTRVALAFGPEIERLAPPTARAPATASVLRESAPPPLRDDVQEEPFFTEGEDTLASASTSGAPYTDSTLEVTPADIIITVDGSPARNPGQQVVSPQLASLSSPALRIPNPDPALLQKTPLGRIPKIGSDGRRASRVYARPFDGKKEGAVAIIVSGLGLNPLLTERAIDELPAEVTLAFAPYAKDLEFWTERARAAGHEIMIELPMEGYGGSDDALGPAALLTSRTAAENRQRLDWLLSRFGGYFAATNYLGGKFSADRDSMAAILARLTELGVAYVDDTGAARQALDGADDTAIVSRIVAAGSDGDDAAAAHRDLLALETLAARNGQALAKAYAYNATIDAIGEWAKDAAAREVNLAPASAVLRARAAGG